MFNAHYVAPLCETSLPIPHRLQHPTGILAYLQYGHTTDNSSMVNGHAGSAPLFTPS